MRLALPCGPHEYAPRPCPLRAAPAPPSCLLQPKLAVTAAAPHHTVSLIPNGTGTTGPQSGDYQYESYDPFDTKRDYDALSELQTKDAVAREAAVALMRFVGWGEGESATPLCPLVQDSILGALGPGLANILKGMTEPAPFLATINSHNETPEILWYEKHIVELKLLCAKQTDDLAEGVCDHEAGINFNYKVTETELCIHGIFVRILVKRTATEGFHEDVAMPEVFFQRLMQWCIDPASLPAVLDHPTRGEHSSVNVALVLQCIVHMLTTKVQRVPAVAESGATARFLEFCAPDKWSAAVHALTLQVLMKCGEDAKFIQDVIKSATSLTPLLCLLNGGTAANKKATMEALMLLTNNAKILLESIRRGVVIYLLAIAASPEGINETARLVLQKMSKSALHGLKVTDAMEQFLPKAVVNGIVNQLGEDEFTFTMECKTPELIWSDDMALQFRQAVTGQLETLYDTQLHSWEAKPELDEEYAVDYAVLEDEMFVGGIYVRLFLKNPQYNIRKPEKFIEALFAAHEALACADGMAKDLGFICTCIITVLKVRVLLCDHLANLGIIERLLNWDRLQTSHGRKAMLKYMHMLSSSALACEKFGKSQNSAFHPRWQAHTAASYLHPAISIAIARSISVTVAYPCPSPLPAARPPPPRLPPAASAQRIPTPVGADMHRAQCHACFPTAARFAVRVRVLTIATCRCLPVLLAARGGEGVKVMKDLMEEPRDRLDVLQVLTKMLNGSKPSVCTEMVMQLEETGFIPVLFGYLKDKEQPIPVKVSGVELMKAMADDNDDATSAAITGQLEGYPEWREYKDAKHDLFIGTGNDLLLLEGGNAETLLLDM
eukprot:SAG22_NODE_2109_length_3004_cov_2.193804_2_plen_837_part_00